MLFHSCLVGHGFSRDIKTPTKNPYRSAALSPSPSLFLSFRVGRLSDNSEDWLVQLYSTSIPEFQWLENKDLISRAHSKNTPN
jgi:hypothetical protein